MRLSFLLCIFGILNIIPCALRADALYPAVLNNMEYHDVLRMMGPPLEKIEREVKREDLWLYHDRAVSFRDGVVLRFDVPADPFAVAPARGPTIPKKTSRKEEKLPLGEILSELMDRPMPRRDIMERIRERHQERRAKKED